MTHEDLIASARGRVEDFERLRRSGLVCLDGDFFPSVHYPPITMYPAVDQRRLLADYRPPDDGLFDVYVHVPFCIRQCVFCHYPVKLGDRPAEKDRYLDALEREMDIYMGLLGLSSIKVRTILFGGGTPTYMSPDRLDRMLGFFCDRLDVSALTQFNFDVDPPTLLGTEGSERLQIMRARGVDRLTIGVQALDDEVLRQMNRPHTAAEAEESVAASREHGFILNTEYIFGFPGQTVEGWLADVERAAALDVDEIQLYRLKEIPYGDHQGVVYGKSLGKPGPLVQVEQALLMKQAAIELLAERGYRENLRRVFSRDASIYSHYAHNQCCELYDQIGFGLTGFSSLRDRFGLNTNLFDEYYEAVGQGRLPLNRGLVRDADDQRRWAAVLPLKNRKVLQPRYRELTGVSVQEAFPGKVERLVDHGLLRADEDAVGLTRLGRFFADEVCHQFHDPRYVPFPREAYADGPLNPYRANCRQSS